MSRLALAVALLAISASSAEAQSVLAPQTPVPVAPPRAADAPPIEALRIAATPIAPSVPFDRAAVAAEVRAVLDAQVTAWNRGSVRDFMEGYAEADSIVFLSGTTVRRGWEEMLYGYLRSYPNAAAMGLLSFDDVTIEALSGEHALVWGRWGLLVDGPLDAQPSGLFTLVFVRTDQGWRIVHDHTS